MFMTITRHEFIDAFLRSDTYKNNFSYDALSTLFEYYEELEEDTGEQVELDIVAIACDWVEYDNIEDVVKDHYGKESEEYAQMVDYQRSFEMIEGLTTVLKTRSNSLVIGAF